MANRKVSIVQALAVKQVIQRKIPGSIRGPGRVKRRYHHWELKLMALTECGCCENIALKYLCPDPISIDLIGN